ncbi:MAG: hypothetical protein ACRD4Q_08220 [Candidatus Acidiferrales bacterium]
MGFIARARTVRLLATTRALLADTMPAVLDGTLAGIEDRGGPAAAATSGLFRVTANTAKSITATAQTTGNRRTKLSLGNDE